MGDMDRMLYNLIAGLKKWEAFDFKGVSKQFSLGFHQFVFHSVQSESNPPLDIPSLIKLLQLPASKWGIKGIEGNFPLEAGLIERHIGLTIEAEEYLEELDNPAEYEQSKMRDILVYCREHRLDQEYRKIRSYLSNPKHAVIPYEQLYMFLMEMDDSELMEKIKECYEKINDLDRYRVCPNCGWTLVWKTGKWQCNSGSPCHMLVDLSEAGKFSKSQKQYLRMTRGIQRYTLIPGIAEHLIANKLSKKGYQVQMYPKIDEFDILVKNNGLKLALDVKDYSHPFFLARNIVKNILNNEFDQDIWFVIPNYRLDIYPSYIKMAKGYIKNDVNEDVHLVSEKELYQRIGGLFV